VGEFVGDGVSVGIGADVGIYVAVGASVFGLVKNGTKVTLPKLKSSSKSMID
jgi:hypothetical protein